MSIILITGGSGLIGTRLTDLLIREGHSVRWLSQRPIMRTGVEVFAWNVDKVVVDERALHGVDHIVHLSGAGIAEKRWTTERLRLLRAGRSGAARLLLRVARSAGSMPRTFVSASGAAYYGAVTSDHVFTEEDPSGNDTIGQLTLDWEDAADEWTESSRVVKLRTPFVIAREASGLKKLTAAARLGLASAMGSGDQWMPWVHVDDLVHIYRMALLDERVQGAYNVCAPEQPTNKDLMRAVAHALHKPFFMPAIPGVVLRVALGELAVVLLEGSRTSTQKLSGLGFSHRFGTLKAGLDEALR